MIRSSKTLCSRWFPGGIQAGVVCGCLLTIVGLQTFAQTVTNAHDFGANGYTGFNTGDNQGFGFGAWTVNTPGGGRYIAGEAPHAFGLWNNTADSSSTATRPFSTALLEGQIFSVQLKMQELSNDTCRNGFALQDSLGNTLFSYWHRGGDNADGHFSDANGTGAAVGFAYDFDQYDTFTFQLTGANTYTFTDLATSASFSGMLSGAPISQVQFFRSNGSQAPGNGNDFKFDQLMITSVPEPSVFALAGATVLATMLRRRKSA